MKKLYLILTLLVSVVSYGQDIPTSGLIAWYPFNGNAHDESGHDLHGTVTDATLTTDRFGNASSAYEFNGSSSFIEVADNESYFRSPSITVSCWAITRSNADLMALMGKPLIPSWTNSWQIATDPGSTGTFFGVIVHDSNAFQPVSSSQPRWNDIWTHLALSFDDDANLVRFYINGIKVDERAFDQSMLYNNSNIFFGKDVENGNPGLFLNGKLDDVAIHNRVLTDAEIRQMACMSDDGDCEVGDPLAWYPFNGNANDLMGTLEGTVNGAVLTEDRHGNANSAYFFDGTDDIILTDHAAMTSTDNWSLTAWVKPAGLAQAGVIVGNGFDNTVDYGNGYAILLDNGFLRGVISGAGWYESEGGYPSDDTWHHVAMVRRNGIMQMYVNGIPTPSASGITPSIPVGALTIGGQAGGRYFHGAIDEVKVFGTGLTADQVRQEFLDSAPELSTAAGVGSGKAMYFAGNTSGQFVSVPSSAARPTEAFTYDLWVKPGTDNVGMGHIYKGIFGNAFYSLPYGSGAYIDLQNNEAFGMTIFTENGAAGVGYDPGITPAVPGKWQHLAITYSAAAQELKLYINGVLKQTNTVTGLVRWDPSQNASFSIGSALDNQANYKRFNGWIDEARMWNVALSEPEIRERMCRKITSTDPRYDNLLVYYHFDQENPRVVTDARSNGHGTLFSNPQWTTSGASIGDASAYTYGGGSVSLQHPGGEGLTVDHIVGNPAGVQIYLVDAAPVSKSGITGLGDNNRYFGVYHFGGAGTSYFATYGYNGNPYVNAASEPGLNLYKRDTPDDESWEESMGVIKNASQKTLLTLGLNTEYILGSLSSSLPVTLAFFKANVTANRNVALTWATTSESSASHFLVERSTDARIFHTIGHVKAYGTTAQRQDYSLTDESPQASKLYYRLRQVDFDGKEYQYRIVSVDLTQQSGQFVYPNPARSGENLEISFDGEKPEIALTNLLGQNIQVRILPLSNRILRVEPMSLLSPGLYMLRASGDEMQVNHKVIISQ